MSLKRENIAALGTPLQGRVNSNAVPLKRMRRIFFGSRQLPKQPFSDFSPMMHDREVAVSRRYRSGRGLRTSDSNKPTNSATYRNEYEISATESCRHGQQIALPVGLFLGILSTWQARFNFAA